MADDEYLPDPADTELMAAVAAIARTRADLEQAQAAYNVRVGKRGQLHAKAEAAETDRMRFEADRRTARSRLAAGEAGAEEQLRTLDASIANARRLSSDYQEAAKLLDPGVDELAPAVQTAQAAVARAEYDPAWILAFRAAARLEAQFEDLRAAIATWTAATQALDAAHRRAFVDSAPLDAPGARLARFIVNWGRAVVGQPHNSLFRQGDYPPGTESLSAPLKAIDRRP
jgi:hypothetical protein